jgi:LysM repeat protein
MQMLEGLKEKATQQIGPLPAFAWVIVVVGGYFGYVFIKNRSSGGTTSTTSTPVGATDTSGSVPASSTDVDALTSQIATLGNQINQLTGQGGSTTTPPNTTATTSTHWAQAGDTVAITAKEFGVPIQTILSLNPGLTISSALSAGQKILVPIGAQATAASRKAALASSSAANAVASAATTTTTVASTAVATTGTPAATVTYGSNTAVTKSVENSINITKAATTIEQTAKGTPIKLGAPTISTSPVKASAVQIPTVTSVKKIVPKTITPPKPTQVVQATKQSIKVA